MKKFILSILLSASLIGCVSTSQQPLDIQKVVGVIEATVPGAVRLAVAKEPKSQKFFEAAVSLINGFALGKDLSPETFHKVINTTGVKELQSPEALAALDTLYSLYKLFYADVVAQKVNTNENLSLILKGISQSLQKGIDVQVQLSLSRNVSATRETK